MPRFCERANRILQDRHFASGARTNFGFDAPLAERLAVLREEGLTAERGLTIGAHEAGWMIFVISDLGCRSNDRLVAFLAHAGGLLWYTWCAPELAVLWNKLHQDNV
jgi:hypothetical protein